MWYNKSILGFDGYEFVLWFILYSILGWLVESIYMSICNKKLTNRGFVKGPFCPIYGFGALGVYYMLRPYSGNMVALFFLGTIVATSLEMITAVAMKKLFGEIWWDYHDKPFNFRGIICLESSIAWGFYTIFLFMFLQKFVMGLVNMIPVPLGRMAGNFALILYGIDFLYHIYRIKKTDPQEECFYVQTEEAYEQE